MTLTEVKTMLESITGFSTKVAYWAWPEGDAPELPFICFHSPNERGFGADNKRYYASTAIVVELYSLMRDTASEALVESKLSENGIYFVKTINYIQDERCFMVQYEIEV